MQNKKSIGLVETQYYTMQEDLKLEAGNTLKTPTIAYETYGKLNKEKSNAILICHALTGSAHAAGWHKGDKKAGWWNIIIGPGKPIDTNKYYVICSNVIGSCNGSTGPASINPETNKEYGLDFPIITIKDMVNAQEKLIRYLKIPHLFGVVGGSMGGMQVLQWTIDYPNKVKNAIMIASAAYSTTQQIAFNEVERRAILEDPFWNNGNYYHEENKPDKGLSLARMIGHITYLSNESMHEKFGRRLQDKNKYSYDFSTEFQVESYLKHQGFTFTKKFDANSYLYLTKALDYFDLRENTSLEEGLKNITSRMLLISISSDWLYTDEEIEEIVMALRTNGVDVTYSKLNSEYGHDAFLLENGQLNYIVTNFLSKPLVKDVMSREIITLHENKDIKEAAQLMMDNSQTHIPVVNEDNQIKGIITAWDLSKSIANNTSNLDEIMTKDVQICHENDSIFQIAKKFKEYNISGLPVIDEHNHVIGSITTSHLSSLIEK